MKYKIIYVSLVSILLTYSATSYADTSVKDGHSLTDYVNNTITNDVFIHKQDKDLQTIIGMAKGIPIDKTLQQSLLAHYENINQCTDRDCLIRWYTNMADIYKQLIAENKHYPCYHEGQDVILSGMLTEHVFPGPPNYDSVANGDKPDPEYILRLDSPMQCILGYYMLPNNVYNTIIQVNTFDNKSQEKLSKEKQTHITLHGTLTYAFSNGSGHYHAPLALSID